MNIDISSNIKDVKKALTHVEKKALPKATQYTVNNLAFEIARKEMPKRADKVFDKGATAWTKRGFGYKKAKSGQSSSRIFIRANQAKYLKYQIDGGTRTPEGSIIAIPHHKTRKNKYGNLTRGQWAQLITNKDKFFTGVPKGAKTKTDGGIYQRLGKGGKKNYIMRAAYKPAANYKKKFKYYGYAVGYIRNPRKGFVATFAKNLGRQLNG